MYQCDFYDNGKSLKINTAKTPTPWYNYLFNDEYVFECSQRLEGKSFSVKDYKKKPVLLEEKYFFVKIDGKIYRLCAGQGESYECIHSVYKTSVMENFDKFESKITVFVPSQGKKEMWKIEIHNKTGKKLNADVFAAFVFSDISYQGLECY